jgi:holo-[acyl-carrier protein] synthase
MMTSDPHSLAGGVVGHGIDLVELADFSRLLQEPACRFLDRHFTPAELAAAGDGVERAQRLAARFAAKEAVMKALGVGWGAGVAFTDVEVVTAENGAPTVILRRQVLQVARDRGVKRWILSTSHSGNCAVASAIALS